MDWRFVRASTRVRTRTTSPSSAQTYCDWENLEYVEGVEGGIGPGYSASRDYGSLPGVILGRAAAMPLGKAAARRGGRAAYGTGAAISVLAAFQPDTLITGVAPCRSAELYLTVSVSDSPGQSVTSLPDQIEDCSSLSPESSCPPAVPRLTSARRKKPTVGAAEALVIVTVVARSAPAGPAWCVVAAVAVIVACGSVCSCCRLAYWESVPCGLPSVFDQFVTSCWVDCQYTLRSTIVPL